MMKKKSKVMPATPDPDKMFELEVYGLVIGQHQPRPMLLMKDKVGSSILPIPLSDIEAQILAHGSDRQDGPHGVSLALQKSIGIKVEKCIFTEIKSNRQVLHIHFVKSSATKEPVSVVESFAESSISYCIGSGAPIMASQRFIDQCRQAPFDAQFFTQPGFRGDKLPGHLLQ